MIFWINSCKIWQKKIVLFVWIIFKQQKSFIVDVFIMFECLMSLSTLKSGKTIFRSHKPRIAHIVHIEIQLQSTIKLISGRVNKFVASDIIISNVFISSCKGKNIVIVLTRSPKHDKAILYPCFAQM